ncbi:MAG: ABC transporter ATP-binding protein [Deltaproteobacteria bacterium]|nr:ABC transporter ATP-binding protein [Deltaproteobacteria bacterium]MBW1960317.1 ABC transporter ATP-binding protein [Deltaproteobacteria bacterium]MBW1994391.1 ABC transporter ATP-binding protein [Deltaproteobacteria bacterium]MBW2150214.1 ABC transporter ATP-binding protein [Deltaproteobacteria bacterium]
MTNHHIITINNLSIHFKTIDGIVKVLKGVSLEVKEGEIVGLVGETGCGKSVTAKTLLGILAIPPARIISGRVDFMGQDLLALSKSERNIIKQKIGYIPQDPMTSLNPVFTIGEIMIDNIIWRSSNMSFYCYCYNRRISKIKKAAQTHAIELLHKVNIPEPETMLNKYPVELSGGMRQRVLIAMSLIGDPVLLIADEPTTALDVTIQKGILRLLSEKIEEQRLSGLYITHDLGVARSICTRTCVMYAGTVVEVAETSALLDEPLHPYTKGLVRSIPKLSGEEFDGIPGNVPDYFNPSNGCRFFPRCDRSTEACESESPRLIEVDKGRFVACNLFD